MSTEVIAEGMRGTGRKVLVLGKAHSYYGAELALVEHHHGPTFWTPFRWLKWVKASSGKKRDLYEALLANPERELTALAR